MKKLLFILLFAAVGLITHAQMGYSYKFPLQAGDTLTNVDTVGRLIPATAGYSVLGIQVNYNKLSGTAAGKAYLLQSLDGVNFVLTDSATYVATPQITSNVLTSGAIAPTYTHTATFTKVTTPSVYYLIEAASSGTVSAAVQFQYTARQYNTTLKY